MLGSRFAVFGIVFGRFALSFDALACCQTKWGLEARCDQWYSSSISAAEPLYITNEHCAKECPGGGLTSSEPHNLQQWARSLVQFVFLAIISSFSVPRRKKIKFDHLFEFKWIVHSPRSGRQQWFFGFLRLAVSLLLSTIILIPVIIDMILWITIIVVCAGNMLVAGLYEAFLDYRIVQRVQDASISLDEKTELLLTLVSGNLIIDLKLDSPQNAIFESLSTSKNPFKFLEQRRVRLLAMLGSQYSFAATVGAPVIFYLGAFVYTIIDLKTNPGDMNSAISLAFGLEWMIIVHVAIISGCLLASNNPSTSAGIVGQSVCPKPLPRRASTIPIMKLSNGNFSIKQITMTDKISKQFPVRGVKEERKLFFRRILLDPIETVLGWSNVYPTKFQPVWMWDRGSNKMKWIKNTRGWEKDIKDITKNMRFTTWGWILKIYLPAVVFVSVPPMAAAVVAYGTPPIGLSCHSLTFLVYATCQLALAFLSTVKNALEGHTESGDEYSGTLHGWKYWAWSVPFLFGSFLAIIGGTVLQLTGAFTTFICYTPLYYRTDPNGAPDIKIASDTQEDRDSSQSCLLIGVIAASFMATTCYVGWWYQRLIRKRFVMVVEEIYGGNDETAVGIEMENRGLSTEHSTSAPLLSTIGDGPSLEELDHEDSSAEASRPPIVVLPTLGANTLQIRETPVGETGSSVRSSSLN